MLKIDMHFKNGILFIKLIGSIDRIGAKKLDDNMTSLVTNNGIKYVLLNLKNVHNITSYGIDIITKNYKIIVKNNGKLILCGTSRLFKNIKITNNLYEVKDEKNIYEVINL